MPAQSPPDDTKTTPHFEDEVLQGLLVEDNPGDARLFEEYLGESSTEATLRHEETLQAGLGALEEERPDVLVVDLGLPDSAGTEGLSAGVFRAGPTGRVEYANEALAEMLGFERAEKLIGLDLTGFCADPAEKVRMLAEDGASDVEVEFEARGGDRFVGLLNVTVASDPSGAPIHYDGTVSDITERVRREDRLRMLSEAVEQARESVVITEAEPLDEPGPRVEYVNAACEKMTGYSQAEMVGKTPWVLQGPETERDVLGSLRAALEAEEEWQGETINYRKDGSPTGSSGTWLR